MYIKSLLITIFAVTLALILPGAVSAQSFESNKFETRVGDPKATIPPVGGPPATAGEVCPVDTFINCGTYWNPRGNCGHCLAPGYTAGKPPKGFDGTTKPSPQSPFGEGTCVFAGTLYGIDIAGEDGQEIKLPTIRGQNVEWLFYGQIPSAVYPNEAIQAFTGAVGNETFYLQLHHTKPGSGNTSATKSGDKGANICADGCNERHTHVQLARGNPQAIGYDWLDVLDPKDQLLCRGK